MESENKTIGAGRILVGSLLGVLLAVISPLVVFSEMLLLVLVVLFPAIGVVFLYRWAGMVPALLSMLLQLLIMARALGGTFMWVAFFLLVMPLTILLRFEQKPFWVQMKLSIAMFSLGLVLSVFVLYLEYGANMTERFLQQLSTAMREVPLERLSTTVEGMSAALGRSLTPQDFYKLFEDTVNALIPVYQVNIPGILFGGVLASAVFCVGLNCRMLKKQGRAKQGVYIPLRRWALPASTTGGLLMMVCVSLGVYLTDLPQGQTLFYTVYNIAVVAFCIQALASMARIMYASSMKKGRRVFILSALCAFCLLGASLYVAMYGCGSAIFGRYGVLREKLERMNSGK